MNIPVVTITLVAICFGLSPKPVGAESLTEFGKKSDGDLKWRVVNDGVMGGLSKGALDMTNEGTLRFSGNLSLENNGGFSSIRTNRISLDLSDAEGLQMRVKGDGRTYQVRVSTDERFRGMEMSFMAEFATKDGKWTEVRVPFSKLEGTWRGRSLPDKKFDPSEVTRLGILLADKQAGKFGLEVDYIRTYGDQSKSDEVREEAQSRTNDVELDQEMVSSAMSAIDKGVPLYNSGDAEGCADVYEACLVNMTKDDELDGELRARLNKVVNKGKMMTADERAWLYRHALDSVISMHL